MTEKVTLTIDVRNMPKVSERPKKVSAELEKIDSGDLAEIIADDEKMLTVAPKMIASIGTAEFIRVWQDEDGYYRTLIRKKIDA